jgi:gliding motility-associated-like protein
MERKYIFAIIIYLLFSWTFGWGQSTFQISLDKIDETIISDVVVYNGQTFMALTLNYNEIEIIKLDQDANIISSNKFNKPGARFTPEPKIFKKKNGDIFLLVPENAGGNTSKIHFYALDSNLDVKKSLTIPNAYPYYDWKHIQEFDDGSIIVWVSNSKNTKLSVQGIKMDEEYNVVWNQEYTFTNGDNMALRSSIIIDDECYVLVRRFANTTGSINYNCVLKIGKNGNILNTFKMNFDPNHIDKNNQGNVIAIGITRDNQLICAKFDNNFNEIWSKEIGFAKVPFTGEDKNALVAIEQGFGIDVFDNIYVTIMEENLDEFDGTKLLKLSPDGFVLNSNILLDGSHTRVDKVLMMNQDIIMKINSANGSIITKLNNQLASTQCSSMPFCTEIKDFIVLQSKDFDATPTSGPSLLVTNPLLRSNTNVSFTDLCNSIDQPYADFGVVQNNWCIGEYINIDLQTLYPHGRSLWLLIHDQDTVFQKSKNPEPFLLQKAGHYKILHTLVFAGCFYQDSITFKVSAMGAAILDRNLYLCPEDSLVIDLSTLGLTNIKWFDGDASSIKTIDKVGKISLTYVDSNGCDNEDMISIGARFLPKIELGDDVTICNDSSYLIAINVGPNDLIRWSHSFTDTKQIIVHQKGLYSVTVSNVCGETEDEISVDVIDCSTKVYYPNIFSPNNDGINDIFEIKTWNASELSCNIYDRWGNLIYTNVEDQITWDGNMSQQAVPIGVYVFTLSYKNKLRNTKEMIAGNVTLIR